MRVDSDACVAKQVGKPLRHQHPDLFDRAAQLQDAHVQTGLGPLCAVPVERNLLLDKREEGQYFIIHFSEYLSSAANMAFIMCWGWHRLPSLKFTAGWAHWNQTSAESQRPWLVHHSHAVFINAVNVSVQVNGLLYSQHYSSCKDEVCRALLHTTRRKTQHCQSSSQPA